jgi:ArsR family transcriptional regulator, lead/cadmium/zinc/bismuth-responsive transcriptional repressor
MLTVLSICEVNCMDEDIVARVQNKLQANYVVDVAKLFKALSDERRMEIAYTLTLE